MDTEKIKYRLEGYYAGQYSSNVFNASVAEASATYRDLLLTDNPFFWEMQVLITRGLTSVQIYMVLAEMGAIEE